MDRAFQRIRSLMLRGTFYSVPPNTYSGLLIMSLTFSVICIKIISCFPSPCTRLSPAQTTTEAPLPCRIFIGLYLIALRRSDLGNPRLRYNNMAMIDCRI